MEETLLSIQENNNIRYAGPLAGYPEGVHVIQGKRILVNSGPNLVNPQAGKWPLLGGIFANMLETDEQLQHFYGWLKFGLEHLRERINNPAGVTGLFPGQALGLIGPKGAAKSLTQTIITALLGGRCARPFQAMSGGTAFNEDWFEAEHLCIEDESSSTDIRKRTALGSWIKQVTVNEMHRCHPKYQKPIMLPPFWRLTLSLNDDPEHLMVLPPLDESLNDKIILLKCDKHDMPMPTGSPKEKQAFMAALLGELPALVSFLLNEWTLPADMESSRFGVKHYHHPAVVEALSNQSPEQRLLDLIDMQMFKTPCPEPEIMRAIDVEKELTKWESDTKREAGKLLSYNTAAGTFLSRLSKSHPHRVERSTVRDGTQLWKINPPCAP